MLGICIRDIDHRDAYAPDRSNHKRWFGNRFREGETSSLNIQVDRRLESFSIGINDTFVELGETYGSPSDGFDIIPVVPCYIILGRGRDMWHDGQSVKS